MITKSLYLIIQPCLRHHSENEVSLPFCIGQTVIWMHACQTDLQPLVILSHIGMLD